MKNVRAWVVGGCLASALGPSGQAVADVPDSKDHPLLSRYPGSTIDDYAHQEFAQFTIPLGKIDGDHWAKSQDLEGKVTKLTYSIPAGRSSLEVFRNYQSALKKGGFTELFSCSGNCGHNNELGWCGGCAPQHVSAKLARPDGDVYASVHVEQDNPSTPAQAKLVIVEVKPMEEGLITVNAEALARDIQATGHASVYGIYFDSGKADVKPESDAALKEIAKLLERDGKLKLYVVGHTDNQGKLESNMELSHRRAEAVVKVLVGKHSVKGARLSAQGDGPTAPVASNESEAGRGKNRRVELVKQ